MCEVIGEPEYVPLNLGQKGYRMVDGQNLRNVWEASDNSGLINVDSYDSTCNEKYATCQFQLHTWFWMGEGRSYYSYNKVGVNEKSRVLDYCVRWWPMKWVRLAKFFSLSLIWREIETKNCF